MPHNQFHQLVRDTRLHLSALSDPFLLAESDCSAWIKEVPKPRTQRIELPPLSPPLPAAPPPPPPKAVIAKTIEPTPKPAFSFTQAMAKVAPQMAIIDRTPTDAPAQQVMNRWKTKTQAAPLSILFLRESPAEQALLTNLAKALTTYFGDARLIPAAPIEAEKQWDSFLAPPIKLLILSEQTLRSLPHLLHTYKEIPATGARTLKEIPIFFLQTTEKRLLWEQLCQTIRPLFS